MKKKRKLIEDIKAGDKVVFVGGINKKTFEQIKSPNNAFKLGEIYTARADYNREGYEDFCFGANGTIHIELDSNYNPNGWAAALFEPYEEPFVPEKGQMINVWNKYECKKETKEFIDMTGDNRYLCWLDSDKIMIIIYDNAEPAC